MWIQFCDIWTQYHNGWPNKVCHYFNIHRCARRKLSHLQSTSVCIAFASHEKNCGEIASSWAPSYWGEICNFWRGFSFFIVLTYLQIKSFRQPPSVSSIEFSSASPSDASLLMSYIDAWAWMDQSTLTDVLSITVEHTLLNPDFGGLLNRWLAVSSFCTRKILNDWNMQGASVLTEQCLEYESNTALRSNLKNGNFTMALIDPAGNPCSYIIANDLGIPYIVISNFIEFYSLDYAAGRSSLSCSRD